MINTELYTEFREAYTDKDTVNRAEFCKKLKKLKKGTIVELDKGMFRIYTKDADISGQTQGEDRCLEIDPAARIRFEGSLEEYEDLLEEINKKKTTDYGFKIFSRLQDGNADIDFIIMDVYYQMQ